MIELRAMQRLTNTGSPTGNYIPSLLYTIMLGLSCACALFVTSRQFVNQAITPRWFAIIVRLYETRNKNEVLALTRHIVDKKIEISFPTVSAIKHETRQLIERSTGGEIKREKKRPISQDRTSRESLYTWPRQGDASWARPHGAALPP
jgi:hypothetical protein